MPRDTNYNADICDVLLELGQYERFINGDIHKYNAYRRAASSLASFPARIESRDEAIELPGIGVRIALKIEEFLKTGTVMRLQEIRQNEQHNVINQLKRVSGIGPAAANRLYSDGIKSIDGLKRHSDALNHHQRIGLKYLEQFEMRIPRNEIEDIERAMKRIARQLSTHLIIIVCGSFRRGAETSEDIDVLLSHSEVTSNRNVTNRYLKDFVKKMENDGLITDRISLGKTKFMGVCQLNSDKPHRRIDIRFLPYDQYYCGLLYLTGSVEFNRKMRKHANQKGFTLNEYSLRKISSNGAPQRPLNITSERDIFEYIDFPYTDPKRRNIINAFLVS